MFILYAYAYVTSHRVYSVCASGSFVSCRFSSTLDACRSDVSSVALGREVVPTKRLIEMVKSVSLF